MDLNLRMLDEVSLQVSPAVVVSPPGGPLGQPQPPLLRLPRVLLTLTQPPGTHHLHQVMTRLCQVRERGVSNSRGRPVPENMT